MTLRHLMLILLLAISGLLTSCGGSHNSSAGSSPPANPPPASPSPGVLAYQESVEDDTQNRFKWYKIDRHGASFLLDDVSTPPEYDLSGFQVSPDTTQIVYWYSTDNGQTRLAIMRLDSQDMTRYSVDLEGVLSGSATWLSDSSGIVYTVRSALNTQILYLASEGEENPVKLFETNPGENQELRHSLATDGSKVTVDFSASNSTGNLASLYLIDINNPDEAKLIDTVSTDPYHTMRFDVEWSPYTSEFVYHAVAHGTVPPPPGIPSSIPDSRPFILYRENDTRQTLGNPAEYAPISWLSTDRLLIDFDTRIDILDTSGGPLVSHTKRYWSKPVPSPDSRRLAFLDDTAAGEAQVQVIDIYSGEVREVGQGSSYFNGVFAPTFDSELRWSPDGSWLAWNRSLDFDIFPGSKNAELYAHEVSTGTTRLVTPDLGSSAPRYPHSNVTWLPEGNVLNYLVRSDAGYEFTTTNLATDTTLVISAVAAVDCWMLRAWPSNHEVLWNRCGDGVYLSSVDAGGSVVNTRLLEGNIGNLVLTNDQEVAVMQRVSPSNEDPPGTANRNWFMYDFIEQRLHELEETSAIPCCGSLVP